MSKTNDVRILAKNLERILLVWELEFLASKVGKSLPSRSRKDEKALALSKFLLEDSSSMRKRREDRQVSPENYDFSISLPQGSNPVVTIPDPTKIKDQALKNILDTISTEIPQPIRIGEPGFSEIDSIDGFYYEKGNFVVTFGIKNYSEYVLDISVQHFPNISIYQFPDEQIILQLVSQDSCPDAVEGTQSKVLKNIKSYTGCSNKDFTTWYFTVV